MNVPSSPEEDRSDSSSNAHNDFDDYNNGTTYDDGFDMPGGSSSPAAARTSFTEMDRTDDDPPPQDDPQIPTSPILQRNGKGKPRVSDDDADQVEDEIERGLNEVDQMNESDEVTAVESAKPTKGKKGNKNNQPPKERKKQVKRKWVEPQQQFSGESRNDILCHITKLCLDDENSSGLRRGKRMRYKPLEYWRLERVTFGRRESGVSMVPVIKDIIRVPKEEPKKLGAAKKRSTSAKPLSRSKTAQAEDDQEMIVFNPEEGWDDNTDPYGVVLEYQGDQEVSRSKFQFVTVMNCC